MSTGPMVVVGGFGCPGEIPLEIASKSGAGGFAFIGAGGLKPWADWLTM